MALLFICLTILLYLFSSLTVNNNIAKAFFILIGGYWCLSLIISISDPFQLYPVNDYTYFLICSGFTFFFIGFDVTIKKNKYHLQNFTLMDVESVVHSTFFRVCFAGSFILIAVLTFTQYQLLQAQGGQLGSVKLDFFELIFNSNSLLYLIYQAFVMPFFYILCVLFPILVFKKGEKKEILIIVLYLLMFSFVGGKRGYFAIVFEIFLIILISLRLSDKKKVFTFNSRLVVGMFSIGLLVYFGAAYMTALGSGSELNMEKLSKSGSKNAENIIIYNIGAYRAFQYALDKDYVDRTGGYKLGRATLGGFVDYYGASIIHGFDPSIDRISYETARVLQENGIRVGKTTDFNFLYTAFMYFYFDFGPIGVFLFSFLFGIFVAGCLNLYTKYRTFGSLCIVGYLFYCCILFSQSWFFSTISAQPTLLLMYLLHRLELNYKRISVSNLIAYKN